MLVWMVTREWNGYRNVSQHSRSNGDLKEKRTEEEAPRALSLGVKSKTKMDAQ